MRLALVATLLFLSCSTADSPVPGDVVDTIRGPDDLKIDTPAETDLARVEDLTTLGDLTLDQAAPDAVDTTFQDLGQPDGETGDSGLVDLVPSDLPPACVEDADCPPPESACETPVCQEGTCDVIVKNCTDGMFCNGLETCSPETGECLPGDDVNIDDGDECTIDACDEVSDEVTHVLDEECQGDTCEYALPLTDGAVVAAAENAQTFQVIHDGSSMVDDLNFVCEDEAAMGGEKVWSVELADAMIGSFSLVPEDGLPLDYRLFIVGESCTQDDVIGCAVPEWSQTGVTLDNLPMPAGTYFLVQDSLWPFNNEHEVTITATFVTQTDGEQACDDLLDNDTDGLIDCCDDDCSQQPSCALESDCFDGLDDDCNGLPDCADPNCAQYADCLGEACAAPFLLNDGIPVGPEMDGQSLQVEGDTTGDNNELWDFGHCEELTSVNPDHVWQFETTATMRVKIVQDFTEFGPKGAISVFSGDCLEENYLTCHVGGGGIALIKDLTLVPGTHYVVVDGGNYNSFGPYTLEVDFELLADAETDCSNGEDDDGDYLTDCCDPECSQAANCLAETVCSDEEDNDCDGLEDCADPDCGPDLWCFGGTCDVPKPLSAAPITQDDAGQTIVHNGNTELGEMLLEASCASGIWNDPEHVWQFTLANPMQVTMDVDFDWLDNHPAVYLYKDSCPADEEVFCEAADSGTQVDATASLAPGTYYLVVDAAAIHVQGKYTLSVSFN